MSSHLSKQLCRSSGTQKETTSDSRSRSASTCTSMSSCTSGTGSRAVGLVPRNTKPECRSVVTPHADHNADVSVNADPEHDHETEETVTIHSSQSQSQTDNTQRREYRYERVSIRQNSPRTPHFHFQNCEVQVHIYNK